MPSNQLEDKKLLPELSLVNLCSRKSFLGNKSRKQNVFINLPLIIIIIFFITLGIVSLSVVVRIEAKKSSDDHLEATHLVESRSRSSRKPKSATKPTTLSEDDNVVVDDDEDDELSTTLRPQLSVASTAIMPRAALSSSSPLLPSYSSANSTYKSTNSSSNHPHQQLSAMISDLIRSLDSLRDSLCNNGSTSISNATQELIIRPPKTTTTTTQLASTINVYTKESGTSTTTTSYNNNSDNLGSSTSISTYNEGEKQEPPRVIDDTLTSSDTEVSSNRNPLHLLLNKFSRSSSLNEYIYLYLILFFILILLLLFALCCFLDIKCRLCFSCCTCCRKVPRKMNVDAEIGTSSFRRRMSFKGAQQNDATSPAISSLNPSNLIRDNLNVLSNAADSQLAKGASSDSIWRKLSSSTSTLIQDESRELRSDGNLTVPLSSTQIETEQPGKRGHFEWYSFEDKLEQVTRTLDKELNSYTLQEDKISKSLRKNQDTKLPDHLAFDFTDRTENTSSSTLTKSELVMLKEKLVPISSSLKQQQQPENEISSQNKNTDNKTANKPTGKDRDSYIHDSLASHFIDSTDASCSLIGSQEKVREKAQTMRHVELPARTSSQVEAIRAELSRVEQRDIAASALPVPPNHPPTSRLASTSSKKGASKLSL